MGLSQFVKSKLLIEECSYRHTDGHKLSDHTN